MRNKTPLLAIVMPCLNEEQMLPITFAKISELLGILKSEGKIAAGSFALYVDDGSKDATWELIAQKHFDDSSCHGLKLARNAGHQNAVMAGMMNVRGKVDCCITMDADIQDDLAAIPKMLEQWEDGCEIVYGVRNDRSTDSFFKRATAGMFYKFMKFLGVKLLPHHADFRLVGNRALDSLSSYKEVNLFLRGIFPTLGFKCGIVEYARLAREAGETKYPLHRMIALAFRGVTTFSPSPLRLAGILGVVVFLLAILQGVLVIADYFKGITVPGWASLMVVVLFLGATQLFCVAVMGEYIAMIFSEVKQRPRYIVEDEI